MVRMPIDPTSSSASGILSAMVTPAVLISACGMLIMSTSNRLARIVDRVRHLSHEMERLADDRGADAALRWDACETQLTLQTKRGRIIQRALTSFYLALGMFVATTAGIGLTALRPGLGLAAAWVGIAGTLTLFYGSMLLIRETALALRSIDVEMALVLQLRERHRQRQAPR